MNFFFTNKRFTDQLDKAVFTTVHVMNENSLITLISHELDGDWQFMGSEPIIDYSKIAMVVSLKQIIKKDKSVLKIADLPKGYQATRLNKKDSWQIVKIEYTNEEIKQMGFHCSTCGDFHKSIPLAYGADAPFNYSLIPDNETEKRCELTQDICVIHNTEFYIKGNLFISVDNNEEFSWNVWVQIPKKKYERMQESWEDENRILEEPYEGLLSTQLIVYPDTLNLKVKVHTQSVGYRPKIEILEISHPLFLEQESGITMDRVISFAKQIMYDH